MSEMMTAEQADSKLTNIMHDDHYAWHPSILEAFNMAVDALKGAEGDCISRAEAIEDAREAFKRNPTMAIRVMDLIKSMPSAQPEIIRCKDCKNYGAILFENTQFEHGECFGHDDSDYTFDVSPDDFCSRAERRTDE